MIEKYNDVDTRDEVAGKTYHFTGSQPFTKYDMATIIADRLRQQQQQQQHHVTPTASSTQQQQPAPAPAPAPPTIVPVTEVDASASMCFQSQVTSPHLTSPHL